MKRLSEVCKIIGITRRTLQEYDRIGLIHPSAKTEGGYWLYDDETMSILMSIQVLVEIGYKRKEIKKLIESPNFDLSMVYDYAINQLSAKQERLCGMLNIVKMTKLASALPPFVADYLTSIDLMELYQNKSYRQFLDKSITTSATLDDIDSLESQKKFVVGATLFVLGMSKSEGVDSEHVQKCVGFINDYFIDSVRKHDPQGKLSDLDMAKISLEIITEILQEPEAQALLMEYCGTGTIGFMLESFTKFYQRLKEE